jgi:hypothetical protein
MTVVSSESEYAERWHQWQRHNAEVGRKAERQVRVIFAIGFAGICAMLAYQLMSR